MAAGAGDCVDRGRTGWLNATPAHPAEPCRSRRGAMSFTSIRIPTAAPYVLRRARVPASLVDAPPVDAQSDTEGSLLLDLHIERGRIAALAASAAESRAAAGVTVDLDGRQVWPTLIDVHAHLDKGHIF